MAERFAAIVQARIGSTRLPGKVLRPLAGRPVILHVVERLRRVQGLDEIVITVPDTPEDQPLIELLLREGIRIHRWPGDPADLLGRYISAARAVSADGILMVDSDCPLLDPDTASRMLAALRARSDAEYVRIAPSSIEGGVACLRRATFERIDREGARGAEREHATLRILEHPEAFRIVDVSPDPLFADPADAHRFWLDTPADARFLEAVFARLAKPGHLVDLRDVVRLLRADPALRALNQHVQQRDPRRPQRLVALVPPDGDAAMSLFSSLADVLAEQHRIGVRTLRGATAVVEAARIGAHCVVMTNGDSRRAEVKMALCEIEPGAPLAHAAERIQALLAAAGG